MRSRGFRCKWPMKFRRVPGQIADEVPEGYGADSRKLMRFQRVPVQIADKVPEGSGAKN